MSSSAVCASLFTVVTMTTERRNELEVSNTDELTIMFAEYECPICYSLCRPPVRTCMEGHPICSDCITKIDGRCPTCRGPIGVHKNLILDKYALRITYPCLYSHSGCDIVGKLMNIIDHERVCPFRPCLCPYYDSGCEWAGEYEQFLPHLQTEHQDLPFFKKKEDCHVCNSYTFKNTIYVEANALLLQILLSYHGPQIRRGVSVAI